MVARIIEALNAALTALDVNVRHGLCVPITGQPCVHRGGGEYVPVFSDQNGNVSYWRVTGPVNTSDEDLGTIRVTVPLRLVALIERDTCDDPLGQMNRVAMQMRGSSAYVRRSLTGVHGVEVSAMSVGVDVVRSQELQGVDIPTRRAVAHINATVVVRGDASCMDQCGADPVVVPGDCPDTTVNGVKSDTHTIAVLQGGEQVGTLDPATGIHTVPACPPGLPGRAMSSDEEDAVPVVTVPPGADVPLPRFIFAWTNKEEEVQTEINPLGFNGTFLTTFPDPMPRFEVRRESDSSVIGTGDITAPVVLLPTQVVKDTNGATIATHEVNEPAEVPDSVLTLPDGSPGILPASSPFDIRTLRSGIVYAVNEGMFSGELRNFLTGDERWAYINGLFTQDYPVYSEQFTRLVDFFTLADNNIYGNANRFTDDLGTQVYAARIVLDHFTGIAWYSPASAMTGNWNTAVGGCRALTVGGHTDWVLPPLGILRTIINNNSNIRISYAPFNIDGQSVHSSTSNPSSTANSLPMQNSGTFQSTPKTTIARYIACRRFAN